jgi:hypothetical protein
MMCQSVNAAVEEGIMVMTAKKRRTTPIKVLEPEVVPISEEDYRQAVTALAILIRDWWENSSEKQCLTRVVGLA